MTDPKDQAEQDFLKDQAAEEMLQADQENDEDNVEYLQNDINAEESTNESDEKYFAEAELQQLKEQMMRAMADAENTRKRALRDRKDIRKYAITDFAKDMLNFADNFRRAIDAIPADTRSNQSISPVINGIEAMEGSMLKILERHGIRQIQPEGEIFNPNFHEVMFEAPSPDKPPGTILQILEPGYMIHDRLLRPARVGVVKDDGQDPGSAGLDTEV